MVRVGLGLFKYSIAYRWKHSITNGVLQSVGHIPHGQVAVSVLPASFKGTNHDRCIAELMTINLVQVAFESIQPYQRYSK